MWIKESIKRGNKMKDHYSLPGIDIFIKDQLPEHVSASFVFEYISSRVPWYLMGNVEIIYVGLFPEMRERDINAYFENDAIYVTSEQDDEMDMIEDIIHEISHSVEQKHGDLIYGDSLLEREFLAKRGRLENRLKGKHKFPAAFSVSPDYDKATDEFLYKDIGYDALNQYVVNIFPSAYSATSISEYWAIGFEEMFLGDRQALKQLCPVLYNKLITLIKELKEQ